MTNTATLAAQKAISALEQQGYTFTPVEQQSIICIAGVLLVLTAPIRATISNYIDAQIVQLEILKSNAEVALSSLQNKYIPILQTTLDAINDILAPVDKLMTVVPLDAAISYISQSQCFGNLMNTLTAFITVNVGTPIAQALKIAGLQDVIDFSGVTSYRDFRNRLDDVVFKLNKQISLSDRVRDNTTSIDQNLKTLETYSMIISNLEV